MSDPLGIPPADAASAPAADFLEQRSLKRELIAELRQSWEEGHPVAVDDLLPRWPSDPKTDRDVASLLFEDYLQRSRSPRTDPCLDLGGPAHQDSVADMVRINEVLRSVGLSASGETCLRMPEVGEQLFGFLVRRELGRGAFARVFLAEQADLAGRPVVLKVSRLEGCEAQTLAQLQHTNIVPIYSVHENERAGLRALCMPYFGGASLSEVLRRVWEEARPPLDGAELIRALDRVAAPEPGGSEGTGGETPRVRLGRLKFVEATVWAVAALADGLAHAHQRGVLHRDIKPSNILLAADGQPMLLDFNLAHVDSQEAGRSLLGGTVAYMSPEHLHALATRSPVAARAVDHRADIYSLGMLLFEMLSGRNPFEQSSASGTPLAVLAEAMALERGRGAPSLRKVRPEIPWGLESIVHRCLDPDPARRYQRAEDLAEDLRCLLEDRPLRHAPELSLREQAQKWARRHPRLYASALVAGVAACLLLAGGGVVAGLRTQLTQTADQLAAGRAEERRRRFEEGTVLALFYVNTKDDLSDHLTRGETACREALDLYDVLDRADWQQHPDWRRLSEADRARLAEDVRDLLLLLAGARVRLSAWDADALKEALQLLARAESIADLPPCRALWTDHATYLQKLGDGKAAAAARERAEAAPVRTARDHYRLAMAAAREREYGEATTHLDEAVRLNPRDYWSWMQRGLCRQELGDVTGAAGDFGVCIGLRPDFAWGYYNRGVVLAAAGRSREALADYAQALELDPQLQSARVNAGMLQLRLGRYAEALAALDAASTGGRDDAALHSGRGIALEGLGRHADADAAFARADELAVREAPEARRRLRRTYAFAVAARLPEQARAAFLAVLREDATDAEALYGCGMLHDRRGEFAEAVRYFTRALEAAPGLEEARRFRAVVLARQGDFAAARRDVNACLGRETPPAAVYYAAACVAALEAERGDPRTAADCAAESLQMLREALTRGYGVEVARDDDDLKGVRGYPEFRRLVRGTGSRKAD